MPLSRVSDTANVSSDLVVGADFFPLICIQEFKFKTFFVQYFTATLCVKFKIFLKMNSAFEKVFMCSMMK